jgi:hypothetical protein
LAESAGIAIVESVIIFVESAIIMVESIIIFEESIIIFEESAAIFSPAMVESFAGAAAAAGAGADSGWDLLHPVSKQAAVKADTASVRIMRCLCIKEWACSARGR